MPLYEYICHRCEKKEERLLPFSKSESEQSCEHCKNTLTKIISKPSFQLKGSGWYSDHYGLKTNGNKKNEQTKKSD